MELYLILTWYILGFITFPIAFWGMKLYKWASSWIKLYYAARVMAKKLKVELDQ